MGQFRVAFPTNHFDAAMAFHRSHLTTETMREWDGPHRGAVPRTEPGSPAEPLAVL